MSDGRTTVRAVVAALLALTALSESTRHGDPASDWWPCRVAAATAGRRRYDVGDVVGGTGEDTGEGTGEDTGEGDGEDTGEDTGGDDGYAAPHVAFADDKRKRGVRAYEKKRPPGNGLRVDPSLLRGETVELSTYVNVPVTLRCKLVPLEGTDGKFETVVEAVYPGHADSPSPPLADSHAARIVDQLVGPVDGWRRNVVGKSARPVRRATDRYYGRRAAAAVDPPPEPEPRPSRFDDGAPRWRTYVRRPHRWHTETVAGRVEPDDERTPHHRSDSFEYRTLDDQLIEPVDDQLIEPVDDRAVEEADRRPADGEALGEELRSVMSDIDTTVGPDYANLGRSDPTSMTFTRNGITTPSL